MHLKSIELSGFKSFAKKSALEFTSPIAGIVGPNGSGKSNAAEAFRFVLGEQSMKAMRGKRGPDMIWSGNERLPRSNRARVAVVFNNKHRLLDIDFDEVVIERIVHRDGANEYTINGSKVRLKDIAALLATANIGASGHHIISQGEADRILGASEKERREMIEEALGLKTYQYKKVESEKKLAKTTENMKEVQILRREIAPHLTFLEKQMKKLERARELKKLLHDTYQLYVTHERAFIDSEKKRLARARIEPEQKIEYLSQQLKTEEDTQLDSKMTHGLDALDERMHALVQERSTLEHQRGRIEGQLVMVQQHEGGDSDKSLVHIPFVRVEEILDTVVETIRQAQTKNDITILDSLSDYITKFRQQFNTPDNKPEPHVHSSLEKELKEVEESLSALRSEESAIQIERTNILDSIALQQQEEKNKQKRYFELKEEKLKLERVLENLKREQIDISQFRDQLQEIEYKAQDSGVKIEEMVTGQSRTRTEQEETLREINKLEARLEEAGFVDEDTVREYEETKKRDEFLEREVADLEASKASLIDIIKGLDDELSSRFSDGLEKINGEFKKFFAMLFDGGDAELRLVKKVSKTLEDEEIDEEEKDGIEIHVQLPRKKVTTLDVLSGGERALTSIALIFAMSQVNPPPFIILDETDAALDEANSRKYADMVRALSERSQLILITHNRQTMEAAGELYGVTMGNDGISKLLSVKFDEAVHVAK